MNDWSVRVEWVGAPLTADQVGALAEKLEAHAASCAEEPNGNPSAQMHVEARTIRQAFDTAVKAVEGACRELGLPCTVTGADIATWAEFERRLDEPDVPPLVGFAEIAALLDVSRQRAREIAKSHLGAFPEVAHTSQGPLFLRASLERFAATWERKRTGRPRKNPA